MQTETTTNKRVSALSSDGENFGQSITDKIAFYGTPPLAQATAAAQAAITDSSGGAAAPTTGVAALTGTYNSAIIANALATVIAQTNAMRLVLVNLGLMKGS